MSSSVSSWFIGQSRAGVSEPLRFFSIGGSDYSQSVLRWPKLKFKADAIDLGAATVLVSNRDRGFNFFVDCGVNLTTSCEIAVGFAKPGGGEERLSLFRGEPTVVGFEDNGLVARLHLQGKTKRLSDAKLGSDTQSGGLNFTGSAYYASDLAWTLITCYGEMSPLASPSNPDLEYSNWLAWRELDIIRAVHVKAYFTGEKVYQALATLAELDSQTVFFQGGKIDFSPSIRGFGGPIHRFTMDDLISFRLTMSPTGVVNDFSVEGDYDPPTRRFRALTTQVNSQSQGIFGRKSGRFGSRSVWFVSPDDGTYLADDRVRFHQVPSPQVSLRTPLAGGIHLTVGDVVTFAESVFQLDAEPFRIVEKELDLGEGTIDFNLEKANQRPWHFQSTVSTYNILVRTISQLGLGTYIGINENAGARRVFRSIGNIWFHPMDTFATALLPLDSQQILFGGPPSSGGAYSVLQRSSDGGSSSVIVSSLSPWLTEVVDIFQADGGTCLASTSSGGIWRSTDGGSSWAHTSTISGAYHIRRFFQPVSGRIWGGTGLDNVAAATGAFLWESVDNGVTWVPRHTVTPSRKSHIQGFFGTADGEWLLSTYGLTEDDQNVYRSKTLSVNSMAWTVVLSGASFTHVLKTSSGHLMFGYEEETTLRGGSTFRSLDAGSSWLEDARISKQGNIRILDPGDGVFQAFSARIAAGVRTDFYKNFDPNRVT